MLDRLILAKRGLPVVGAAGNGQDPKIRQEQARQPAAMHTARIQRKHTIPINERLAVLPIIVVAHDQRLLAVIELIPGPRIVLLKISLATARAHHHAWVLVGQRPAWLPKAMYQRRFRQIEAGGK